MKRARLKKATIFTLGRYRLPRTLRSRRAGYLTIVVLLGVIGGAAMASVAAARRTDSSNSRFLAVTNPSDFSSSRRRPVERTAAPRSSPS